MCLQLSPHQAPQGRDLHGFIYSPSVQHLRTTHHKPGCGVSPEDSRGVRFWGRREQRVVAGPADSGRGTKRSNATAEHCRGGPCWGAGGRSSSHPNPLIIHSTNVYAALGSEASPVLVAWNAEMALLQQDAGMRSGNSEGSPGLWSGRVLRRLGDCGGSNCWHSAPWQALPPSWASVSPPV